MLLRATKTFLIADRRFQSVVEIERENFLIHEDLAASPIAAALAGTLSTRTTAAAGELTMGAGHGIQTGARIDLYWTIGGVEGARRGVTVGTVVGNAVPISLGAGDDLPAQDSAILAAIPEEHAFAIDGDDVVALAFQIGIPTAVRGTLVFAQANDTEEYALVTDEAFGWYDGEGPANPLAGQTAIAKVFLSHSSLATQKAMVAALLD